MSVRNFTWNHSILLSDPGNESYGPGGSNTLLKYRIGMVVAEILHDTFRSMLSKLGPKRTFCSVYIGTLKSPS